MSRNDRMADNAFPASMHKLRWYQYRLSSILWTMLIIAMLIANITMRNDLYQANRQIENLKEMGAQEIKSGFITQVSSGPGWSFRGDLPEGKWQLAVYSWHGELKNALDEQPLPNLAPLVVKPILNYQKVHIEVSEALLPPNTMCNGKTVATVYNFKIFNNRPGQNGPATWFSTEVVFLSSEPGRTSFSPQTMPILGKRGIVLWEKGGIKGAQDHLLLQLEPAGSDRATEHK